MTDCDVCTTCVGLGLGIREDDIRPLEENPELIEARLSKEVVLSYDSNIEESLTRVFECILDKTVRVFTQLYNDWGPDSKQTREGHTLFNKTYDF